MRAWEHGGARADLFLRCHERNFFGLTASNCLGRVLSENPRSTVVGRRRTAHETRASRDAPGDVAPPRGRFASRGGLTVPTQETPAREAW